MTEKKKLTPVSPCWITDYANKQAHVELAERMKQRDAGIIWALRMVLIIHGAYSLQKLMVIYQSL